ncbi:MAG TPA: nitroreductase family protein [bacterium]|nr:nitroreductase family protein [bacterium]
MDPRPLLNGHRSIRSYRPDPIDDATLHDILHAATRASSSGNMQTYSIVVTRDAERRRALWRMHFEQDMILQAPVLLTFCADWHRMTRWCELSDAEPGYDNLLSFLVAFADALITAQNAAIAAEGLGLGICYLGTTLQATRELTEFLELPPRTFPATTLVIGHPDEDPEPRARLPMESIVHRERYEPFDDERIRATYAARELEGWNRYLSFPELADRMRTSGVRNLAQVYTRLKYTREDNDEASEILREGLRRAGFLD